MSDSALPPAWMDRDEIDSPPARVIVHRESAFQVVAVAFIKRIVLPPMFVAATVNENEMTDNARARAKKRGMVSGLPDLYVAQAPCCSMWLELKWGGNKASSAQVAAAMALSRCGVPCGIAWSIHHISAHLANAGFTLHLGAKTLAQEYQARAEAAVRKAELDAVKKAAAGDKPGKTRGKRFTSRDRKAARIYAQGVLGR